MDEKDEFSNIIIFNKYLTEKKLGEGSFGLVYLGTNIQNKEKVAIKLENKEKGANLLETEAYNMSYLKGDGIPQLYCFGCNSKYNILIMEILGQNLEFLFDKCGKKFSLRTVLLLAIQMIERIRHVHEKNLVHRDLKPENFMIGYNELYKNKIYLIDFGLCAKYRSASTKEHIPMKTGKSMTGTARYASINAHRGYEQSRRDDLESLGYIFIYFLKGYLPWQGIKAKRIEEKFQLILDKKLLLNLDDLCSNLPKEFSSYIEYCRNLQFSQEPDYNYLLNLFYDVMKREKIDPFHLNFDWLTIDLNSPISAIDRLNKSAGAVRITNIDKNNKSFNISNINISNNNLNKSVDEVIQKKPSLVSGVRRRNSGLSSKKVSFGKVEICIDDGTGKPIEERVVELPKHTTTGETKDKKKANNACCLIY